MKSPDAALLPPQPENRVFTVAIVLSIVVHIIVLLIRFGPPDPSKLFNRGTLEIILVNARAFKPSARPDAYAQFNLDGGGNTDQANQHIKTPLPAQDVTNVDQDLALKTKLVEVDEARNHELLSKLANAPKLSLDTSEKQQQKATPGVATQDVQQNTTDVSRLEGEIDKLQSALEGRPHKDFIGARTISKTEALYIDKWREHIEKVGTERFPTDGKGKHLLGSPIVQIEILKDGTLSSVAIQSTSGNKSLDEATLRIVKAASPFAPLPPNIVDEEGKPATSMVIFRTFNFTHAGVDLAAVPSPAEPLPKH